MRAIFFRLVLVGAMSAAAPLAHSQLLSHRDLSYSMAKTYIEAGDPPLQAALKGSEQIGFTIISLTVSLIAVLIPLLFKPDVVGPPRCR